LGLYIAFFTVIAGSVTVWLLLEKSGWLRVALAVLGGAAASIAAGIAFARFFFGSWAIPTEAVIAAMLGPAIAAFISLRNTTKPRPPGDLRDH
jgi:hypothetical protein